MVVDKKIIIGNWKMNLGMHQASLYLHELAGIVKVHRDVEVVLAPTVFTLQSLSMQVNLRQFKLAVQNFYWRDRGPYTGEVSATQLRGIVQYGIVGHAERRHQFHETDKDIRNKVAAAIRNDIRPILCIGETAWERSNGEAHDVLHDQLLSGLTNVSGEDLDKVIIAYEPVWAIGTGQNAMPSDVRAAIDSIRSQIKHLYGEKASKSIQIIYGGSVTAASAAAYLGIPGISGLLIGEASLNSRIFNEIIEKAHSGASMIKGVNNK